MKVYEDMKGAYIRFKPKYWKAGYEFMVVEDDDATTPVEPSKITLVLIKTASQ